MQKKIAVIHQPDFMPYLGFFHRLLNADVFVILDHVQFINHSKICFHRRDKIKTASGEQWITVGIRKTHLGTPINQVLLTENVDWRQKNINLIRENYRNAPFFKEIFPYIIDVYNTKSEKLIDFNLKSITILMDLFDIHIQTLFASSLDSTETGNELIVEILRKINADVYISGIGAKNYFVPKPYLDANIEVIWQNFVHPVYPQMHGEFLPYLSSIDLLFNCGIEESRTILRSIPVTCKNEL